jgi:hypothetical protein
MLDTECRSKVFQHFIQNKAIRGAHASQAISYIDISASGGFDIRYFFPPNQALTVFFL